MLIINIILSGIATCTANMRFLSALRALDSTYPYTYTTYTFTAHSCIFTAYIDFRLPLPKIGFQMV